MQAAVDDVAERLHRQLRRYVDRLVTREREPAEPAPGEWSHRSWSPPRPPAVVRPIEGLDHDVFLFHDADTDPMPSCTGATTACSH